MENCVFYGRFSSKKQNETSTEAQLAECKAFAERNGYNIIGEYVDKEISGRSDARHLSMCCAILLIGLVGKRKIAFYIKLY